MSIKKIQLLTQDVSEKIAAGEVVDRPYCAVKELIENSIDAEATRITIDIKDRGVELIKITDNGWGMPKEDLEICTLRHATSKIIQIDDLEKIDTMGFRGEALAAISRVSKTEIKTKQTDSDLGYSLITEGGSKPVIKPTGMSNGTQIIIKDLFYNTPARKKFLKSKQSEYSSIISNVENIALAHPTIGFKLIIDDKEKLNLHQIDTHLDRIKSIFKDELAENLIPLDLDNGTIKIHGFISSPTYINKKRNNYFFFVNNRIVISKLIIAAVNNAYSEHLVKGRYPIAFIFAELKGEFFDINVHPRKIDVKFVNEQAIFTSIRQATRLTLQNAHALSLPSENARNNIADIEKIDKIKKTNNTPQDKNNFFANFKTLHNIAPTTKLQNTRMLSTYNKEFSQATKNFDFSEKTPHLPSSPSSTQPKSYQKFSGEINNINIIGRLPTKYILAYNSKNDFILIDQHAAHERINYEQLKNDFLNKQIEIQGLLIPEIVTLNSGVLEIAEANLEKFEKFGFLIEKFGNDSLKITAVPSIIEKGHEKSSFLEMLSEINPEVDIIKNKEIIDKIIMTACKNSVKAGQKLSIAEMDHLIKNLFKCKNPYHCPHGRPTIITMTQTEIDKKFSRIL
ncbi:MAG: DNA mismatch repair endonuclease MutL [bacterium]|nr:DNA mismatch repair endonuclease MutL [bacterium]